MLIARIDIVNKKQYEESEIYKEIKTSPFPDIKNFFNMVRKFDKYDEAFNVISEYVEIVEEIEEEEDEEFE